MRKYKIAVAGTGYVGLSMVIVGPKDLPLIEQFVTDEIANHVLLSVDFTPGAMVAEYVPEKYYYNGVLLPEIPADVLASYPSAVIVKYLSDGGYRLYAGSEKTYFVVDAGINKLVIPESSRCRYDYNGNKWVFFFFFTTATYFDMSKFELVWSNHDIPDGSATATAVYFEATPLVPEVTLPRTSYNGHMLPAIPAELLELYPYAFIYKNATNCTLILSCVPYSYREATDTATARLSATNASGCIQNYRFPVEYEQEIVYWPYRNNSWYYWDMTDPQMLLWSNYNILNETTGEVYFHGSN